MLLDVLGARARLALLPVLFALPFALPVGALPAAEGEQAPPGAAPASGRAPEAALAAALAAIKPENVRADIFFLASDEMQGRYTPSPELAIAARYLSARLARLGFEHGAPGGYFFEYPLSRFRIDVAKSGVSVTAGEHTARLSVGEDCWYRYPNVREDRDTEGGVVYCGAADPDALAELALEGSWALVLDDGSAGRALSQVRRAGALGALVVPTADYAGDPYAERFGSALEQAIEGSFRYGDPGGRRRMSPFPQVFLTREAGLRFMAAAGVSAEALPAVGTALPVRVRDERRLDAAGSEVIVEDVCGFWRGSDPDLWRETILISAHYDHIGARGDEVNNGADDNGSGTTGLLAIAEALAANGPMRRSVMLIWVSGEERGLWGSAAWAANPWLPEGARPVANLNIDMIGRNAPDELYITPSEEHEGYNFIVQMAERSSSLEGFPQLGNADEFYHRSDQANFAKLDIPVAFLFSGLHEDYHQPTDTPDKIDYDKVARVARLVVRLVAGLQTEVLGG